MDQLDALQESTLAEGSVGPEALAEATAAQPGYPVTVTLNSAVVNERDHEDFDAAGPTPEGSEELVTASTHYTVTWDLSGGTKSEPSEDASDA